MSTSRPVPATTPRVGRRRAARVLTAAVVVAGGVAATTAPGDCPVVRTVDQRATPTSCGLEVVGGIDLSAGGAGQLDVHDGLAAVVLRDEGLVALVDVRDPAAPVRLGSYDGGTGQPALDHPLDGDVVFTDDGAIVLHARQTSDASNEGLHVLDVRDPAAPVRTDLVAQGGMLRVAYGRVGDTELVVTQDAVAGLTIFELLRTPLGAKVVPLHVDPLPGLHVGGPASAGLVIEPSDPLLGVPLLYASDGTTGLRVYDLTDPVRPQLLGAWDQQGLAAVAVEVRDGRRLVHAAAEYWFDAGTPPELLTLDATDLGAITEVARRNLGGFGGELAWKLGGLELAGDELYVAHGHAGLAAIDPATDAVLRSTTELGTAGPPSPTYGPLRWFAMDVRRVGDLVHVTDAVTGELRILRVPPDPAS